MRAIELFAGAGGLGIGVTAAGFSPAAVLERDRWCCDTIRDNQARGVAAVARWPAPIESDIRAIDFRQHEGKIDLVTGGPPCQPFSLGGKHRAQDDARDMWPEAVRVVRETRPRAFIFENVKGLMRASFSGYLSYVVMQLSHPEIVRRVDEDWEGHFGRLERHRASGAGAGASSYRVVHRVLNAADHGVPQKRERVVFVGFRDDLDIEWSFPAATHSQDALLRDQGPAGRYWDRHRVSRAERRITVAAAARALKPGDGRHLRPWSTVRDAIAGLPDPEHAPAEAALIANHRFQPGARVYPGHTGSLLDEPAKTLKAGVHGVPGGENMLVRSGHEPRYFSVRESARLQTFPDDYAFHGSWSETMRQLGNAVPVRLASIIAADVRTRLASHHRTAVDQ